MSSGFCLPASCLGSRPKFLEGLRRPDAAWLCGAVIDGSRLSKFMGLGRPHWLPGFCFWARQGWRFGLRRQPVKNLGKGAKACWLEDGRRRLCCLIHCSLHWAGWGVGRCKTDRNQGVRPNILGSGAPVVDQRLITEAYSGCRFCCPQARIPKTRKFDRVCALPCPVTRKPSKPSGGCMWGKSRLAMIIVFISARVLPPEDLGGDGHQSVTGPLRTVKELGVADMPSVDR
jgi:hypothetical protein